jgi:predicted DNA-binding transcriptional regulator YafY
MDRARLEEQLAQKKRRLQMYYDRETEVLSQEGVKSYGIGSRNLTRYDTALKDIQDKIKTLESEITQLENALKGIKPRRAVGVVPRDW